LFESEASDGIWSGLTDNYLRVQAPAKGDLSAQYRPVTLTRFSGGIVTGKLAA
ncbi:MAG: tRNA (N(6)-L-threonylcarbamoyladenosine(37)-C(2))-methylthiotransferase MtaB, partial [Candidatus Marinimicrobia bacterium]|nr:tRNA (N(6)-L-threonylcarbamoyladenosine(37)-C(2))-methylthiotransferase MtaB [Candidatus Neomarinimicrobiota bacterium]